MRSVGSVSEAAGQTGGFTTAGTSGTLKLHDATRFSLDGLSLVSLETTGAASGLPPTSVMEHWLSLPTLVADPDPTEVTP